MHPNHRVVALANVDQKKMANSPGKDVHCSTARLDSFAVVDRAFHHAQQLQAIVVVVIAENNSSVEEFPPDGDIPADLCPFGRRFFVVVFECHCLLRVAV